MPICGSVFRNGYVSQFIKLHNKLFKTVHGHLYVRFASNKSPHCMELVRKYDYENFLATLLLPQDVRTAAFAIRAFNIEISQVTENTTQKELGLSRLFFWKQFIDRIDKDMDIKTPVTSELSRVVKQYNLSKHWLKRMVEVRENHFGDKPFLNCENAEDYGEKSLASSYYLILQCLKIQDLKCDHVASHVGKAQSLCNLIRGVPHNASRDRVALPLDILMQNNVSQEDIIRRKDDALISNVIYELANLAHEHVLAAKTLSDEIPPQAFVCFLPLVSVNKYLKNLEKVDFNVFSPKLQKRNGLLPMSLLWHKWTNKI